MRNIEKQPCDRCGTPTTAMNGRCVECIKKGNPCIKCGKMFRSAVFDTCIACRDIAKGKTAKCENCGKAILDNGYKKCYDCLQNDKKCKICRWYLKEGKCQNYKCTESNNTSPWVDRFGKDIKPWESKEWKNTREKILKRTNICESCKEPFTKEKCACVSHLRTDYRLENGVLDCESYLNPKDKDVQVLCKPCNRLWTKYHIYKNNPRLICPKCGKNKDIKYFYCYECNKKYPVT